MADRPTSRERAQILAHAIRTGEPYEPQEAAALLEALAAQLAARDARARNALALVGGTQAHAAFALLALIPRGDS